jgi:uncharacterized protein YbjT (DUF2867 family)
MFVVAGVTGKSGSVVAERLLSSGKKVRVLVRDAEKGKPWAAKGAEVAIVKTFEDAAALTAGLRGAEGAYLLSPPDLTAKDFRTERRPMYDAMAKAIDDSGVAHVVFLSSVGAQHDLGTGPVVTLHDAEKRLAQTNAKLTFIRAAYLLENFGAVAGATKAGKLPSFLPADFRFPVVTTRDIGLTAAKALLEGPSATKTDVIELAGERDVNAKEVAEIFAKKLGHAVTVEEHPFDAVVPTFTSFGISPHIAGLYREMYEGMLDGRIAWEEGGHTRRMRGDTDLASVLGAMV